MKKRILIIFALLLLFSANSVLGATFGYETIGAFGNTTLNKISGTLSTLSVAGSVEKISVYFKDV